MELDVFREVMRLVEPIRRKVKLAVSTAVVELVRDSLGLQRVQISVLANEVAEPEHMQPGGLTHVPLAGAEGLLLAVGGERGNAVAICISDRRHRPKNLASGETALYNEGESQTVIKISADGDIDIALAAGAALKVNGSSQSAMRADAFLEAFATWIEALDVYVKIPTPSGSDTTTYETTSSAFSALFDTFKSSVIKGS